MAVLAVPIFTAALPARANQVWDLLRSGRAAAARGDLPAAAAAYERAARLAPKSPEPRVELGAVLLAWGRVPEAIATYLEALRIAPRNLRAEIGLAEAYRKVPNFDQTKHVLEQVIRQHPNAAEPLALIGDVEIQLQTYDAAIAHLKSAVRLAPANLDNRNLLAAAYRAKGDADSALAQLRTVLTKDPKNALALYLQAEIFADRNQDDRALPEARQVTVLQPNNPRGRLLLGKILLRTAEGAPPAEKSRKCNEAVAALEPVATTNTARADTLYLLSRAYRCAGRSADADRSVAEFEAASQADRNSSQSDLQSRHLVQQANDAAMKNDRAGALDLLQQALAKNPNDGAAYSLLAKIYYSSGEIDKASDAIAQALQRAPFQPDFLYVKGKILEKQGKLDEALAAFAQTTLVNPNESDAYFEAGVIYQKRSDRARAQAAFKKAVELSPDDPDYRRALGSVSDEPRPR